MKGYRVEAGANPMTLPDALEQLANLADFLDREIAGCCDPDDEFVIAPMFGVEAMKATRQALRVIVDQVGSHGTQPLSDSEPIGTERSAEDIILNLHLSRPEGTPMTIDPTEWQRLMTLRAELFAALTLALEEDPHSKSYEGHFRVLHSLPNYYEDRRGDHGDWPWRIYLDCYVIGPNRHYIWAGQTFAEALTHAEIDVRAWIAGNDDSCHFIED